MNHTSNKNCSDSRRRLLKTLFGAAAVTGTAAMLPQQWTRPLVEAVVLPVHAQASVLMFGGADLSPLVSTGDTGSHMAQWMGKIVGTVVPVAQAAPSAVTICAILSGNLLTVTLQGSNNHGQHQGTLNTDGTPGTLPILVNLCAQSNSFDAYVSGFNAASGFTLNLSGGGGGPFSVFVPLVGSCPGFATLIPCT